MAETGGLLGMQLDKADLLHLAQTALFGVIGVLALLLVLRPMVLRHHLAWRPARWPAAAASLAALAGPIGCRAAGAVGAGHVGRGGAAADCSRTRAW